MLPATAPSRSSPWSLSIPRTAITDDGTSPADSAVVSSVRIFRTMLENAASSCGPISFSTGSPHWLAPPTIGRQVVVCNHRGGGAGHLPGGALAGWRGRDGASPGRRAASLLPAVARVTAVPSPGGLRSGHGCDSVHDRTRTDRISSIVGTTTSGWSCGGDEDVPVRGPGGVDRAADPARRLGDAAGAPGVVRSAAPGDRGGRRAGVRLHRRRAVLRLRRSRRGRRRRRVHAAAGLVLQRPPSRAAADGDPGRTELR